MSLDAVGIVSKNLKKSISFYEILGLHFKAAGSPDHLEGTTSSGVRIMLDTVDLMKKINPAWKEPQGTGIILCFKQESPPKVDEIYLRFTQAGFRGLKAPADAFWGQRYASLLDPDANQIDIFANL